MVEKKRLDYLQSKKMLVEIWVTFGVGDDRVYGVKVYDIKGNNQKFNAKKSQAFDTRKEADDYFKEVTET